MTVALVLGSFLLHVEPLNFYYIIAVLYLLTVFYSVLLIKRKWIPFLVNFQLIADVILETIIIHLSGGIDSIFVFLYIPTVVCGSLMLSQTGSGIITGFAVLCYSFLITFEYYNIIPLHIIEKWSSYNQGGWVVLYLVCFRMIIIGFASYLSSYLARSLSEKTKELLREKDLSEKLKSKIQQDEKMVIMGELASGIVHEIRNPLASICGSIELLRERGRFDAKDGKLVDIILKESEHLMQVIEEFLYYSKGKTKNLRPYNINEVIGEVVMVMKNSPRISDNINLVWNDTKNKINVLIDADQIKQVFINFINNAVEAMPGGGRITISASADTGKNGGYANILVGDNGDGIPCEILMKIFEPFFSTKENGYGIGLAVCKKIIEDHNGAVDVESEAGKGTVFKIRLPLAS